MALLPALELRGVRHPVRRGDYGRPSRRSHPQRRRPLRDGRGCVGSPRGAAGPRRCTGRAALRRRGARAALTREQGPRRVVRPAPGGGLLRRGLPVGTAARRPTWTTPAEARATRRVIGRETPRRTGPDAQPWRRAAPPGGKLASSSASHAAADASDGIRQSPRGESEPPATTLGPLGRAERLNWFAKKRREETANPCRDGGGEYAR